MADRRKLMGGFYDEEAKKHGLWKEAKETMSSIMDETEQDAQQPSMQQGSLVENAQPTASDFDWGINGQQAPKPKQTLFGQIREANTVHPDVDEAKKEYDVLKKYYPDTTPDTFDEFIQQVRNNPEDRRQYQRETDAANDVLSSGVIAEQKKQSPAVYQAYQNDNTTNTPTRKVRKTDNGYVDADTMQPITSPELTKPQSTQMYANEIYDKVAPLVATGNYQEAAQMVYDSLAVNREGADSIQLTEQDVQGILGAIDNKQYKEATNALLDSIEEREAIASQQRMEALAAAQNPYMDAVMGDAYAQTTRQRVAGAEKEDVIDGVVMEYNQMLRNKGVDDVNRKVMVQEFRAQAEARMAELNSNQHYAETVTDNKALQNVIKFGADVMGGINDTTYGKLVNAKVNSYDQYMQELTQAIDSRSQDMLTSALRGAVSFGFDTAMFKYTLPSMVGGAFSKTLLGASLRAGSYLNNKLGGVVSALVRKGVPVTVARQMLQRSMGTQGFGRFAGEMLTGSAHGAVTFGLADAMDGFLETMEKPNFSPEMETSVRNTLMTIYGTDDPNNVDPNEYARFADADDGVMHIEEGARLLWDATKQSFKNGVGGAFAGAAFVGTPFDTMISRNGGLLREIAGGMTRLGINATGMTAVQAIESGSFDDVDRMLLGNILNLGILDAVGMYSRCKSWKKLQADKQMRYMSKEQEEYLAEHDIPKLGNIPSAIASGKLSLPQPKQGTPKKGMQVQLFERKKQENGTISQPTPEQKAIEDQINGFLQNTDVPEIVRANYYELISGHRWRFSNPTKCGNVREADYGTRYAVDMLDENGKVIFTRYYGSQKAAEDAKVELDEQITVGDLNGICANYAAMKSQDGFDMSLNTEWENGLAEKKAAYDRTVRKMNSVGKKGLSRNEKKLVEAGLTQHEKDLCMVMENVEAVNKMLSEKPKELTEEQQKFMDTLNRLLHERVTENSKMTSEIQEFEQANGLEAGSFEKIQKGHMLKKEAQDLDEGTVVRMGDRYYTQKEMQLLRKFRQDVLDRTQKINDARAQAAGETLDAITESIEGAPTLMPEEQQAVNTLQAASAEGSMLTGQERSNALRDHAYAKSRLAERLGCKEEELDAVLGLDRRESHVVLMGLDADVDNPQTRQLIRDYIVSRECSEGALGVLRRKAADAQIRTSEYVNSVVGEDGNVTSLFTKDNKQVFYLKGKLQVEADGTVTTSESDATIGVYDPETGKPTMISPADIMKREEPIPAEEFKQEAIQEAIQEAVGEDLAEINGAIRTDIGEQIDILSGNERGVARILAINEDGSLTVDFNGKQVNTTRDALQQMHNAANRADTESRYAAKYAPKEEAPAIPETKEVPVTHEAKEPEKAEVSPVYDENGNIDTENNEPANVYDYYHDKKMDGFMEQEKAAAEKALADAEAIVPTGDTSAERAQAFADRDRQIGAAKKVLDFWNKVLAVPESRVAEVNEKIATASGEVSPTEQINTQTTDEEIHNGRAATYGGVILNEESKRIGGETLTMLDSIGKTLGITITFDSKEFDNEYQNGYTVEKGRNGLRVIVLNPNAVKPLEFVTSHELTHALRKTGNDTGTWNTLVGLVKDAMGDTYQSKVESTLELYNETLAKKGMPLYTEADAIEEVVADFIGEAMQKDPEYLKKLVDRVESEGRDSMTMIQQIRAFIDKVLSALNAIKDPTFAQLRQKKALEGVKETWANLYEYVAARRREAEDTAIITGERAREFTDEEQAARDQFASEEDERQYRAAEAQINEQANQRKAELDNAKDAAQKLKKARSFYSGTAGETYLEDESLEPQTIEEYVSNIGMRTLSWEGKDHGEHHIRGFAEALYGGDVKRGINKGNEASMLEPFFAKKGEGMGYDEFVHSLWEGRPNENWTDQDIADALNSVLMSGSSAADIRNTVLNNRIEAAEAAARAEAETVLGNEYGLKRMSLTGENREPVHVADTKNGSVDVASDGTVRFSLSSEEDPENKKLIKALANTMKMQWAEGDLNRVVDETRQILNDVAPLLDLHPDFNLSNGRMIALDKDGKPAYNVFMKNSDTNAPTIEFSTNCVKKEAMNNLMEAMRGENILALLNNSNIDDVIALLRKHGYDVPCDMCYVESKRNLISVKEGFQNKWNEVADLIRLNKTRTILDGVYVNLTDAQKEKLSAYITKQGASTVNGRIAKLMLDYPELRGRFDMQDIMTPTGTDVLFQRFGHTPMAGLLAGYAGATTPKPIFSSHPFDQRMFDAAYDAINPFFGSIGIKYGGFRSRSFSDADPNLFVDEVQMRRNLVLTKSGMFGYTKVPYIVDLFGETGEFHNMSLVVDIDNMGEGYNVNKKKSQAAKYAGLIKVGDPRHKEAMGLTDTEYEAYKQENGLQDGDWDYFFSKESFPVIQALAFRKEDRFNGHVGTIIVSVSDEMTRLALDDDRIDMIIGYHASSKGKESSKKTNYYLATNHEGLNETGGIAAKKPTKNYLPDTGIYAPVFVKNDKIDFNINEACQMLGDARIAANAYLEWCEVNGFTPKYEAFKDHPNYYKLLVDFRRYNNDGTPLIQTPLDMKLPKDWATRLDSYLSERKTKTLQNNEIAQNESLMKDVRKMLGVKTKRPLTNARGHAVGEQSVNADVLSDGKGNKNIPNQQIFDKKNAYASEFNAENVNAKGEELSKQLSDAGVIPEGSKIMYSLSSELDEKYPDWRNQETKKGGHNTQITGTTKTYEKIGEHLKTQGFEGKDILDASSGKGLGTQALRGMGFNVDDVEPFQENDRLESKNGLVPATYSSYDQLEKQYDVVISNAVLNVIPDDWRAGVVADMAKATKVGGKMIVNVRSAEEIRNIKNRIVLDDDTEVLVAKGKNAQGQPTYAYQKGWAKPDFRDYMQEQLGEGWTVEIGNEKNSGTKSGTVVVATKNYDNTPDGGGRKPFGMTDEEIETYKNTPYSGEGDFGKIYDQFKGNATEAVKVLFANKGGDAIGALQHESVGDVDLVWGKEGTGKSDGFGLAKLVKFHPEVVEHLQELLDGMREVSRSANRINLESDTHKAAIRLTWNNKRKTWLLTEFEKEKEATTKRTDTGSNQNADLLSDTALQQTSSFADKGTNNSVNVQEKGKETSAIDAKKQRQAEIVNRLNPKDNSLSDHTWIESAADIKTFDEAMRDFAGTPDFTLEDAKRAQMSGKITVYSSNPIEDGAFVTPSKMQAKDYAGGGKVYSKEVNTDDVAWIDSNEGQMVAAGVEKKFSLTIANSDPFYSNAAKATEDIKQEKATAEQWKAMLTKAGGVKAEEDKWMGLTEWLDSHKGEKLTKAEVQKFIADNAIRIEETHYVEEPEADAELQEKIDRYWDEAEGSNYDKADAVTEMLREEYGDDLEIAGSVWYDGKFHIDNAEAYESLFGNGEREINGTRLGYTTEGLTNNKEIALTVPTIEPYNETDEVHFGDAGEGRAVAWIRFGDSESVSETDGHRSKVLVIDEIQSKRHQDGREKGYVNEREFGKFRQEMKDKYGASFLAKMTNEEYNNYLSLSGGSEAVPDAPFQKNWHELAMKRMLRYAAENGYDKIAWTTGEQQAERYDLTNHVRRIDWANGRTENGVKGKKIRITSANNRFDINLLVDDNGTVLSDNHFKGQSLKDIVGTDIAKKIMSNEGEKRTILSSEEYNLEGDDLKIGGEGMKGFYDKMLPNFMSKYGKKWGAKVGEVELNLPNEADRKMWSVDVTPEMKEGVMQGQPKFSLSPAQEEQVHSDNFKKWFGDWEKDPEHASKVVGEDGKPLILHHGTENYGFTVFDTSKELNQDNIGSHFGDEGTASEFGENMYNVYLDIKKPWKAWDFFADNYDNAYLDAISQLRKEANNKNVNRIAERIKQIYPHIPEDIWRRAEEEGYNEVFDNDRYLEDGTHDQENRENLVTILRDMLEAAGYDGIRYQNWYEGNGENDCWVALEPEQIKSADTEGDMTNNGEFSRNNPDIRYSISQAREATEQNPTLAQKKAGNYKMGHVKIDGYDFTMENPKGGTRSGVDADGKEWSIKMNNDYGYFKGVVGRDKDNLDIFLSDDPTQGDVYIVDQYNPDGSFDEHKVMYGFNSKDEAKAAYLSNYEEGWQGLGAITGVTKEQFGKWANASGRKVKPFAKTKYANGAIDSEIKYSLTVGSNLRQRKGETDQQFQTRVQNYINLQVKDPAEARQRTMDEIKSKLDDKRFGAINRSSLNKMMKDVRDATDENLPEIIKEVHRTMNNLSVRSLNTTIDRLTKLRVQKKNGKGMSVADKVDDPTRKAFEFLRGKLIDIKATDFDGEKREINSNLFRLYREKNYLQQMHDQSTDPTEQQSLQQQIDDNMQEQEALKIRLKDVQDEIDAAQQAQRPVTQKEVQDLITDLNEKYNESLLGNGEWTEDDAAKQTAAVILNKRLGLMDMDADIENLMSRLDAINITLSGLRAQKAQGSTDPDLDNKINALKQQANAIQDMADDAVAQKVDLMSEIADDLNKMIEGGKDSLNDRIAEERERKSSIILGMWGDINDGKFAPELQSQQQMKENEKAGKVRSFATGVFGSFEYMAQHMAKNSLGKDSWFYRYFMQSENGVMAANDTYNTGIRETTAEMNNKAQEIFGKDFKQVMRDNSKVIDRTGIYKTIDSKGMQVDMEMPMSKGQATYLYMVWKMPDGRAKLEKMGFTEESIARAMDFIGQENVEWADWVQEEFLTKLREKYNQKYVEMYNTSMAAIDNYVPLKIFGATRHQDVDVAEVMGQQTLNQKTGSLVARTRNLNDVDLTNSAYEVIAEHIQNMEEWNAYARIRQDLNYVLSSTAIRNQLNANEAGGFDMLKKAAMIATGTYRSEVPEASKWVNALTQGLAGANIAFRNTTALKQMLSMPAFLGYSQDPAFVARLMYNTFGQYTRNAPAVIATMLTFGEAGRRAMQDATADGKNAKTTNAALSETMRWCIDNIPSFRNRVAKGSVGNVILDELLSNDKTKFDRFKQRLAQNGMAANGLIDAITCAIGIKSIYDYKHAKLLKEAERDRQYITDEEYQQRIAEADRLAKNDADIYYNGTQQSNHPAFLAPVQMDGDIASKMFTLYKNSPISYARKAVLPVQELWKLRNWDKLKRRQAGFYMQSEGLTHDEAMAKAQKHLVGSMTSSLTGLVLYGWVMNALWNYGGKGLLGFFQDEDEEEKNVYQKTAETIAPILNGVPVVDILVNTLAGQGMSPLLAYAKQNEMSDIIKDVEGYMSKELFFDIVNTASRVGVGIDLNTLRNTYLGAEGLIKEGSVSPEERTLLVDAMLLLNTPNSNRKQVARKIYSETGCTPEQFDAAVLKAEKVISASNPVREWVLGQEVLTETKHNKIRKDYAQRTVTDKEKAKLEQKNANKPTEIDKAFPDTGDLQEAYDTETDPMRKLTLGKVLDKRMKTAVTQNRTEAQKYEETRESMYDTSRDEENADKEYLRLNNSIDRSEDFTLARNISKLKKVADEFARLDYTGTKEGRLYLAEHQKELRRYAYLTERRRQLSDLKKRLDDKKLSQKSKNDILEQIREIRHSLLYKDE